MAAETRQDLNAVQGRHQATLDAPLIEGFAAFQTGVDAARTQAWPPTSLRGERGRNRISCTARCRPERRAPRRSTADDRNGPVRCPTAGSWEGEIQRRAQDSEPPREPQGPLRATPRG